MEAAAPLLLGGSAVEAAAPLLLGGSAVEAAAPLLVGGSAVEAAAPLLLEHLQHTSPGTYTSSEFWACGAELDFPGLDLSLRRWISAPTARI